MISRQHIFLCIALVSLCYNIIAQPHTTKDTTVTTLYGYRIYFADKQNSPFSISQPEAFLSQRAIDKRNRYGIGITEEDLPVNPAYLNTIRQLNADHRLWTVSKWTNTATLFCYDTSQIANVRAQNFVDSVISIDNYYFYNYSKQSDCRESTNTLVDEADTSIYGAAYRQIALHNGDKLHAEGFRGEGILIAVLDGGWTGFNQVGALQNLYLENRILGTYNVIPHENDVYSLNDHGTCCTSTIACDLPYSMVGTAPDAEFVFIRTEDPPVERLFEEDFWVRGAEIADSIGADVISSSLGYHLFDDTISHHIDYSTCDGQWSIASRAATMAAHRGMIVCVAAGNEGMKPWHKLSRPSDAKDILCVGAVNVDSLYAPFSGCGPSFDGRVKPDVAACGWGTYVMRGDGSIQSGNGTSFATPIIAGLSACLWQAIPQLNSLEIMQIIRESAHQYNHPDTLMGYGIPDFYQAWLSHHTDNIEEYGRDQNYRVYPNPCHTQLTMFNPQEDDLRLELFDLSGRMTGTILRTQESAYQLNLSHLSNGIYFLRIQNSQGVVEVKKIMKQ